LYADDILLLAPTVAGLQYILNVCEEELQQLDMCINVKKSVSIRFGARFNADFVGLSSKFGRTLKWVNSCRYLGIYFVSGRTLKCAFCNAKSQFFSDIQCGLWQSWTCCFRRMCCTSLCYKLNVYAFCYMERKHARCCHATGGLLNST